MTLALHPLPTSACALPALEREGKWRGHLMAERRLPSTLPPGALQAGSTARMLSISVPEASI